MILRAVTERTASSMVDNSCEECRRPRMPITVCPKSVFISEQVLAVLGVVLVLLRLMIYGSLRLHYHPLHPLLSPYSMWVTSLILWRLGEKRVCSTTSWPPNQVINVINRSDSAKATSPMAFVLCSILLAHGHECRASGVAEGRSVCMRCVDWNWTFSAGIECQRVLNHLTKCRGNCSKDELPRSHRPQSPSH